MLNMTKEILAKKYDDGNSLDAIAADLGCSITTVVRKFKQFGIERRRPGKLPEDLTGMISGRLSVESMVFQCGRTKCLCSCNCGEAVVATPSQIKSGRKKSCGCDSIKNGSSSKKWVGCGEISGTHWRTICNNAKQSKKSKEFSITIEHVWDLYLRQQRRCALTGLPIAFAASRAAYQRGETTASLDRTDSSLGYTEDNIQWIHKDVNRAKNDLGQDRFLEICELVTKWKSRS